MQHGVPCPEAQPYISPQGPRGGSRESVAFCSNAAPVIIVHSQATCLEAHLVVGTTVPSRFISAVGECGPIVDLHPILPMRAEGPFDRS